MNYYQDAMFLIEEVNASGYQPRGKYKEIINRIERTRMASARDVRDLSELYRASQEKLQYDKDGDI
jgi:hypothetical protein